MPAKSSLLNFNAPVTQASLSSAIQAGMAKAGFTALFDQTTSSAGLLSLVYQLVLDDSPTGTVFLEIQISSALGIQQRFCQTWNTITKAPGANVGTLSNSVTFVAGSNFQIVAIDHPECREIIITQATTSTSIETVLGYLRPAEIPEWWRRDIYPFVFMMSSPSNNNFALLGFAGALSPFNSNSYSLLSIPQLAGANSANSNKVSVLSGLEMVLTGTNQGEVGKFSAEVAVCASTNQRRGEVLNTGTTGFFVIVNSGAGGMGILSNIPA